MKTLLTLFVLFFSSSIIASDDLSGKKIVCYKKSSSGDTVYLTGFDFKNFMDVYVYTESNNRPLDITSMSYKTSASMIIVGINSNYKISRKTLEVESRYKSSYLGNQCSLVTENITDIFQKYLKEYKKDNLI